MILGFLLWMQDRAILMEKGVRRVMLGGSGIVGQEGAG